MRQKGPFGFAVFLGYRTISYFDIYMTVSATRKMLCVIEVLARSFYFLNFCIISCCRHMRRTFQQILIWRTSMVKSCIGKCGHSFSSSSSFAFCADSFQMTNTYCSLFKEYLHSWGHSESLLPRSEDFRTRSKTQWNYFNLFEEMGEKCVL